MPGHRTTRTAAIVVFLLGLAALAGGGPPAVAQTQLPEGYRLVDEWTSRDPAGDIASLRQPMGVDVASDSTLFVVDQQSRTVYHLDPTGAVLDRWQADSTISTPSHVAASHDRVYVVGANGCEIRSHQGAPQRVVLLAGVTGVDVGPDDRVYIARHTGFGLQSTTVIDVLEPNGDPYETWDDDPLTILSPRGLAVAPDGRVYLAADGVVYEFTNGTVSGGLRAPNEGPDLMDVAADGEGRLFAVQASSTRRVVAWTTSNRQPIGTVEVNGARALDTGPGQGLVATVQVLSGFTGLTALVDRGDLGGERYNIGSADRILGQIVGPRRLATSPSGDLFLTDNQERVQLWSSTGEPRAVWPSHQDMPYLSDVVGGADMPCATGSRAIACFAPLQRTAWSAQPSTDGWIVAADGAANEVVAFDLAEQRVSRYSRAGSPLGGWDLAPAGGFVAVADAAVDNDTLFFIDRASAEVKVVGLDGRPRGALQIPVQGEPERLAARDGRVYVLTRDGVVWKFDDSGLPLSLWEPAPGGRPTDLAVGPNGRVYVADRDGDRILVFEPGGMPPEMPPPPTVERCVVTVDKWASPTSVLVGKSVDVNLMVEGTCPYGSSRLDIVLAIDRSGSMTGRPMVAAQSAAVSFLGQLDPATAQASVIGIGTTATMMQTLTPSLRDAVRAVGRLSAGGQTNFSDAMDMAKDELASTRSRPDATRILVIMTDGKPTDRVVVLRAAQAMKAEGITLYTIGLGTGVDSDLLREMASSPDLFFEAPTESELADVYLAIARRLTATKLLQTGTVVDTLPADMELVAGSLNPSGVVNGSTLEWSLVDAPTSGTVLRYQVRPRQAGTRPTNVSATLDYVDSLGESGVAQFPVPYIDVRKPERKVAHFPLVWRNRCEPRKADVVFVFDTSSSMNERVRPGSSQTKLDAALQAGRIFLDKMQFPGDQAAVVTFNSTGRVVQPLTGARGALELALTSVEVGAGTMIDRGLELAVVELLTARHNPRNNSVIVVLSDGIPTPGTEVRTVILAWDALAAGQIVYTIGLGSNADRDLLREVAIDPSRALYAPGAAQLDAVYKQVAGQVLCY